MAPSGGGGEYPAGVGHRGGGHRRSDRADHQHRRGLPGEKTGPFYNLLSPIGNAQPPELEKGKRGKR